MDETFTLLPLYLDPSSKAISAPSLPATADAALITELTALNQLHRSFLNLDTPSQVPPPPLPLNPKRSAQIQKMREQGNAIFRKSSATSTAEAIKLYSYGLDMALGRPGWEPAALVKDEVSVLLANRAQAHMNVQQWPEGAADANTSVVMKRVGNAKAWWRRGKCLVEMGRWEEARDWVEKGLELEGNDGELKGLMGDVMSHLEKPAEKGS
ncbi:hypothetical protein MMC24_004599 [Lignoscripta atroalba]|nr:hypothetical protein [Lignoscripta atroalba]